MEGTSFHARSNSLPSDRPHPLVAELDGQICRLRQSEASSSSVYKKLSGLQDLYDCVDQLLQLPLTQQAIFVQKSFNELLDGSLRLLDLCSTAKDALSQMKESVFELQSAIRRRSEGGLEGETRRYLNSRKIVKKAIQKVLKKATMESRTKSSNESEVVTMLREAEAVSVSVLESLLGFISETGKSKSTSSWSIVSKLKRVAAVSDDEANRNNEFAKLDASWKTNEEVQARLKNLELRIQDLEEGVESLNRRFIKTRASILNMYNI